MSLFNSLDNVVLPVQLVEGDRVGILVEDQRGADTELHDHETLGSDSVGKTGKDQWRVLLEAVCGETYISTV